MSLTFVCRVKLQCTVAPICFGVRRYVLAQHLVAVMSLNVSLMDVLTNQKPSRAS